MMTIQQAISNIKSYHKGEIFGKPIDEEKTRDKVLYGDDGQELKGIVTTCFASVDVIRKAGEMGANLIISHEALFWNHGDHGLTSGQSDISGKDHVAGSVRYCCLAGS